MQAHNPTLTYFILHWLVSGIAMLLTSKIVPGVRVSGLFAAVFAALFVGLGNATIWWVLFILTLPLNIITLGLFTFVVNGAVLKIVAALMPGFSIKSWGAAILGSLVLSIFSLILHYALI